MKLSYEDKIKIYELRQSGQSIKSLSKQFAIAESSVKYMIRLIDRHGINIVKKGKNTYYPPELKQEMIDKLYRCDGVRSAKLLWKTLSVACYGWL